MSLVCKLNPATPMCVFGDHILLEGLQNVGPDSNDTCVCCENMLAQGYAVVLGSQKTHDMSHISLLPALPIRMSFSIALKTCRLSYPRYLVVGCYKRQQGIASTNSCEGGLHSASHS